MSMVDGSGLVVYRVTVSAAFGYLRFGAGVDRVPQDGDGLGHECEGDAALDCLFDPVLGFADAGEVFPVVEADFDGPPGRVAGDDLAAVAVMSVVTIAMS